jgi:orotidine-5'-phosphate decarboxylase
MAEATAPGSFAAQVAARVATSGPLCAGIDPSVALLRQWGLATDAGGLRQFGLRCVEAFAGVVPVVKPQVAFFERCGSAGLAALESVIAEARSAGLLAAWLDPDSPLGADAVTAVPYLGLGALQPMVDLAAAHGRGVIVVVRSSNPEGHLLQQALTDGGSGPAVEDRLLGEIAALNGSDRVPTGTVGAVIGATLEPSAFRLPQLGGVILAPGVGAQGAGAAEVGRLFAGCPTGSVLASASRSILGAGPDVDRLATAARKVREEMTAVLA